jgi:protocatechuate 4,5-dioxygenase alpha chain
MTGMSQQDYAQMMLAGGRSPEGNRSKSEWQQRQPQTPTDRDRG